MQTKVVFFLLLLRATPAAAFITPIPHAVSMVTPVTRRDSLRSTACRPRKLASEGVHNEASTTTTSGKRRKRKDASKNFPLTSIPVDAEKNSSRGPMLESKPQPELNMPPPAPAVHKENVVVMKVRDIRDVVSGAPETILIDQTVVIDHDDSDDDNLAEDEEWEYFDVDENGNEIIAFDERVERKEAKDDSIEQLLADARQMRRAKPVDEGRVDSSSSMKNTILDVISNIVTVDFFVVIGLLAWFLAGIFCSSVLHNDAVQIAFNMNFERVTQP